MKFSEQLLIVDEYHKWLEKNSAASNFKIKDSALNVISFLFDIGRIHQVARRSIVEAFGLFVDHDEHQIFTDGVHLVSTNLVTLHTFAYSLGLSKNNFHGMRKGHPHYDIPQKKIIKALDLGAIRVSDRVIVEMFQRGILATK